MAIMSDIPAPANSADAIRILSLRQALARGCKLDSIIKCHLRAYQNTYAQIAEIDVFHATDHAFYRDLWVRETYLQSDKITALIALDNHDNVLGLARFGDVSLLADNPVFRSNLDVPQFIGFTPPTDGVAELYNF